MGRCHALYIADIKTNLLLLSASGVLVVIQLNSHHLFSFSNGPEIDNKFMSTATSSAKMHISVYKDENLQRELFFDQLFQSSSAMLSSSPLQL